MKSEVENGGATAQDMDVGEGERGEGATVFVRRGEHKDCGSKKNMKGTGWNARDGCPKRVER